MSIITIGTQVIITFRIMLNIIWGVAFFACVVFYHLNFLFIEKRPGGEPERFFRNLINHPKWIISFLTYPRRTV